MNYDKIMEIHWKCHIRARRQQCVDPEYLMDFAKMVAKECAALCDPQPGFKYSPNAKSSREDCKNKILTQFGVEE